MVDLEGFPIHVDIMPYRRERRSAFERTICVRDVEGYLIPLTPEGARKLAKALKRAATEMESG